ncbi:MAG: DEAD/DEAH box helicase [Ignavibacteriales bacterium]|nr:DEAD/DEAH box helicase [Ignavibacteriales bacterium]
MSDSILEKFHPVVHAWFTKAFGDPSPPQVQGWPSIANGNHTLIVAPTGSGKTLAAFLWCINHLVEENILTPPLGFAGSPPRRGGDVITHRVMTEGVKVLYISPLKALNNDIHRNLEVPLNGISDEARLQGINLPLIRKAVRTGDTTQSERASMLKHPPDILITTPESLYLMLSSEKARKIFHSIQYVIVDEIHAISNNKRGVHLSITLERLEELIQQSRGEDSKTFVRIGLSATQKPLQEVANFLVGLEWKKKKLVPRPVTIIDAGYKKKVDLQVICAPHDFTDMLRDSVWNSIYPKLLEMLFQHRSTLIFVNNRRLAERLSAKLNEMLEGQTDTTSLYSVPVFTEKNVQKKTAAPFKVFAYHGSMSRTVREQLESDLKSGKLRALVTTSALELGIDIGSVDLVVQIQSPKGIARGLQRVGRSGHLVSAHSKGRIFVTHREDLLESAVVAKAMTEHAIEKTFIPKNCLDVLAQQVVAMVGVEEWNVEELFDVIRRSCCYHTLTENIFHSVLDMVAGRFTNEAFRELRARIVWDKLHNALTSLPGSSTLALMNAGTIPDRGYYGVYLEDLKTKVGEVDEEFIYESRTGDTFILGTNVWRMMDIDANKVIVQPAPGHPARMPFWRGEMIGRTYELCLKLGEFTEQLANPHPTLPLTGGGNGRGSYEWLEENFPVDEHSIRNIIEYIVEQKATTQLVPSHKTIVVEGFRDEIGDPRILVHSRFGKGVNGLLGIILLHHFQQRLGIEVQMLYNDDGILFRCSDVERLPLDIFSSVDFHSAEQIILEQLPSSPLFGAMFRQNAERALLLPKGNPGKRRPFFLQRLKAADLLQIVKQYNDFPIVIETMRECLNDVLDFEHFKEVLNKIEEGEIRIHTVQTEFPSPFASSLLFDFTMIFMYESDDPKSSAKEQFAQLNRELLSEVVQLDTVKTVVRGDAIVKVEEQLQFTSSTRQARTASELMEIFLRLGELSGSELNERSEKPEFIRQLIERNIIIPVSIGVEQFYILAEELPIYLPFSKVQKELNSIITELLPAREFKRDEALRYVVLRMLRSRGPLTVEEIATRYDLEVKECEQVLQSLKKSESLVFGFLTKEIEREQWCYRPNLERIHRASINILRKEIKPATIADFTQLLLQWQHRHPNTHERNEEGVRSIIDKMQGFAMPSELWEAEIFRTRIHQYDGNILRSLASRGEIISVGTDAGKSQWIVRGDGIFFLEEKEKSLEGLPSPSLKVYEFIKENGASFLSDIREGINLSLAALNRAVADLFWRGLITNDVMDEILNVKRYRDGSGGDHFGSGLHLPEERIEIVNPRRNPFSKVAMRGVRQALKNVPGWHGRWSLVHMRGILGSKVTDEEKIQRQAQQLLLRYGIVAREIAKREENLLSWSILAMEFQRMEMRGEIRRGYFVEGLSGMQFAIPDAVRMLETIKTERGINEDPIVVNACDPSNPYGVGIDVGNSLSSVPRISRLGSNFIIFHKGVPIIWLESFGARMYFIAEPSLDIIKNALLQFVNHVRSSYADKNEIVVEYCDNLRPSESAAAEILRSIGFYRDKIQTMRLDLR